MQQNEFLKLSGELKEFLVKNSDLQDIPEKSDLLNLTTQIEGKIEKAVSKDGVLRVGVVGQVKAGKSSFINALLFDGQDILPKASTPMTAALTVIKYGEKPSAEVEFYSKADWEVIERNSKEFEKIFIELVSEYQKKLDSEKGTFQKKELLLKAGESFQTVYNRVQNSYKDIFDEIENRVSLSQKSAYEVIDMARRESVNTSQYLDKREEITGISSIPDLVGKLHQFVGADGKFTPITRNTVLKLPIESLKEIELIDTPGVNDPIVSRGVATRNFLSQCDTVFLLSTSTQFMGSEDAQFLVNTLPAEGVTHITLLGSQFDSVLVDEFKKYRGDIKSAIVDLTKKLERHANSTLQNIIASNPDKPIMEKLKNRDVKFISGIAYNIAKKGRNSIDENETHALQQLEKRYKIEFSDELLLQFARIDFIRENDLENAKRDREEILANKLNDLISGQSDEIKKLTSSIKKGVEEKIKDLESADISQLQKREKELKKALPKIREDVKQVFVELGFGIEENILRLQKEIRRNLSSYLGVKEENRSREESYSAYVGERSTSKWYNPFSWGSSESVYETRYRTINYKIASVVDSAENASNFVQLINEQIDDIWDKLVNIKDAEKELIRVALTGFNLEDENFNKNSIINPVKNALREITIDRFRVSDTKYRKAITDSFSSSEVQDSEIYQLKERVRQVLNSIVDDIEEKLEKKSKEIKSVLNEKGSTFVSSIESHSEKEMEQLRKDLADIEGSKKRYNNLITKIDSFSRRF